MNSIFSEYRLSKWRRLLLLRDIVVINGQRKSFCPMCNTILPTWRLQAHHIRPKSLYPHLACQLRNGICLCLACHMGKVHGGNSFRDLQKEHQWKFYVPSFDRYVQLIKNHRYNQKNQIRI